MDFSSQVKGQLKVISLLLNRMWFACHKQFCLTDLFHKLCPGCKKCLSFIPDCNYTKERSFQFEEKGCEIYEPCESHNLEILIKTTSDSECNLLLQ